MEHNLVTFLFKKLSVKMKTWHLKLCFTTFNTFDSSEPDNNIGIK
jgi:hypothetical protein